MDWKCSTAPTLAPMYETLLSGNVTVGADRAGCALGRVDRKMNRRSDLTEGILAKGYEDEEER